MKLYKISFYLLMLGTCGAAFASDGMTEEPVAKKTTVAITKTREIPEFFTVEQVPIKSETVIISKARKIAPTNPKLEKVAMTGKLKPVGNCGLDGTACRFKQGSATPMWWGSPKTRSSSRELVKTVESKNGIPWFDDSINQFDSKNFTDDFKYANDSVVAPHDQDWNKKYSSGNGLVQNSGDKNWDPSVDYEHFEYMSNDEYANRKTAASAGGYIDPWVEFYEKRSCPPGLSMAECKQLMERPHFVEAIPAVAPGIPVLSDHDRYTQRAVEELFLSPQTPNSYWVTSGKTETKVHVKKTAEKIVLAPIPVIQAPVFVESTETIIPVKQIEIIESIMPTPIVQPIIAFNSDRNKCGDPTTTYAYETCAGTQYIDCPFATEWECKIWFEKPHVREAIAPKAKKIKQVNIDSLVAILNTGEPINAGMEDASPLIKRYEILQKLSRSCCTEGIIYNLKHAGGAPDLIYKFLVDDANFYGFGERCLMMTDMDLDKYLNTATSNVVGDVRNGCICRQKQTFKNLLAPFQQVGEQVPGFAGQSFDYTYIDGLGREITTSINADVQNVMSILERCP